MGREHKRTTCFVVIPYGKKRLPSGEEVDFERVFLDLIVPACYRLPNWNIAVERAKDDPTSGIVSERFITDILDADLCIADITGANPNVFYELGLRHAFADKTTVLIGGMNASLPFDISGISCLWYDIETEAARVRSVASIAQGIDKALTGARTDSPVYKFLPDLRVSRPSTACRTREEVLFKVVDSMPEVHVGIISGALNEISDIDIWVNSENTEMEMARPMARSVSSVVRYWGARRHKDGRISRDLIQNHLKRKLGFRKAVAPATVIDTPPGELRNKGVRQLLHVATASGEPGQGYRAVRNLGLCVRNCLIRTTELNKRFFRKPLRSILFPLFGTGDGGRKLEEVFPEYLDICVNHLKASKGAKSDALRKILFLAFTEQERDFLFKTIAFRGDLEFESEAALEPETAGSDIAESALTFVSYIDGVLGRATVARRKGDLREELNHLHTALRAIESSEWRQRFKDNAEQAATLIRIGGRVSDVYARTGGVYRRLGDLENAIKWLKAGAEIESSDERFHRFTYNSVNMIVLELLAGYLSSIAQRQEELRELDHRLLFLVSNERKSDTWAWADLAVINVLLGQFKESTSQIEQCLSLAPDAWPSLKYTLNSLADATAFTDRLYLGGLRDILASFDSRIARAV